MSEDLDDMTSALKLFVGELALYRGNGSTSLTTGGANGGVSVKDANGASNSAASTNAQHSQPQRREQSCSRVLLKFTRVPKEGEIALLKALLPVKEGGCPGYLIIPAVQGGARKMYLGAENSLDAAQCASALAGLPVEVVVVTAAKL
jgi:hypothetical protein